jgi:protein-S-isoprenylcysteine O-methyltransferase Ste14
LSVNPAKVDTMPKSEGEHPFGDIGQLVFLGLFLVLWIGDSFFLRATTFMSGFVTWHIRLLLAAPVIAVAAWLAVSGHAVVRPEGRTDGIVSTGAFKYVRHPLYLASILFYLCLSLATASLLSLALSAGIAVFYDYIAGYEEDLLRNNYGEEYSKYRERTGKWLPAPGRRLGSGRLSRSRGAK